MTGNKPDEQVIRHDITPSYEIEVEWTDSVKGTGLHYRAKVLQRIVGENFKDEFASAFEYLRMKVEGYRTEAIKPEEASP